MWLEPYPDNNPSELNEQREHIATAFVVAIQRLPPRQRAALLLKDVLGFSVPDIVMALDTTQPSVNSALRGWLIAFAGLGTASLITAGYHLPANFRLWGLDQTDAEVTSELRWWLILHVPRVIAGFVGAVAALRTALTEARVDNIGNVHGSGTRQG